MFLILPFVLGLFNIHFEMSASFGFLPCPPAASATSFFACMLAARFIKLKFVPPPNRFKATNREPVVSLVDTASGTPLLFSVSIEEDAAPPPPFCAIRFIGAPRLNLERKGAPNDDGNSCREDGSLPPGPLPAAPSPSASSLVCLLGTSGGCCCSGCGSCCVNARMVVVAGRQTVSERTVHACMTPS